MWHQRGETKLCILTDPDLIELELCMNVYSDITVMVDCALSTSYLSCVNVRLGK